MVARFLAAVLLADAVATLGVAALQGISVGRVAEALYLWMPIIGGVAALPLVIAMGMALVLLDRTGMARRLNHPTMATLLGGACGSIVRAPLLQRGPITTGAMFGAAAGFSLWLTFRTQYSARGAT